jgi:hypothetical protein
VCDSCPASALSHQARVAVCDRCKHRRTHVDSCKALHILSLIERYISSLLVKSPSLAIFSDLTIVHNLVRPARTINTGCTVSPHTTVRHNEPTTCTNPQRVSAPPHTPVRQEQTTNCSARTNPQHRRLRIAILHCASNTSHHKSQSHIA